MRTLVEQGVLLPGQGLMSMEYKGQQTVASLAEDGRIQWSGEQLPGRVGVGGEEGAAEWGRGAGDVVQGGAGGWGVGDFGGYEWQGPRGEGHS